ncbi:hypothetical protein GI584_02075 [Gracilibacillus salitolerans]|uniref:Uncharacterized protein n=1 Tax=Gracilibacillus salitolerans TaxID=2663022 RepID=A0A5Q2TFI4_9BACI|nr:hypothetical protein [Gracilibacillus salitolerans]QGH32912.1 hypothetical protein GI584_02075 [Gracilibacillus salitolerans]
MNILALKRDAAIKGKNGIAFIIAATIIWLAITVVYLQSIPLLTKNIILFFLTAFLFPLALAVSTIVKADWKLADNPLGMLGLFLNLAQFMYFPIIFWAFMQSPKEMIIFFAIVTGAHFFPYGWFYEAKPYYIFAPIISVSIMLAGWTMEESQLWIIPLMMVIFLFILSLLLYGDYKSKVKGN